MESRIFELPFVHSDLVLSAYRPGSHRPGESTLRTLRSHGVLSTGLVEPIPAASGRFAGRLQLFCTLSLDAMRLYRREQEIEARQFAEAAELVEQSTVGHEIAHAIASRISDQSVAAVTEAFRLITDDEATLPKVRRLMQSIESAYSALGSRGPRSKATTGRVIKVAGDTAFVQFGDRSIMRVRRGALEDLGVARLGAPVVLRVEEGPYGRQLIEIEPALEFRGAQRVNDSLMARRYRSSRQRQQAMGLLDVLNIDDANQFVDGPEHPVSLHS